MTREQLDAIRARVDAATPGPWKAERWCSNSHSVAEAYGAWGQKQLYGKTVTGVIRSTIVVGPTGLVEVAQYNVRATGHVAKLMRDLSLT